MTDQLPPLVQVRSHSNHWFNRASDLRASAGAVWLAMKQEPRDDIPDQLGLPSGFHMFVACQPVYHMLCGLSLEVILKAVLIRRGEQAPKSHDLIQLATLIGQQLSEDDENLLRFYTSCITWAGRYPLPTNPTDEKITAFWSNALGVLMRSEPMAPGSMFKKITSSGAADWEPFHTLWQRFGTIFHALREIEVGPHP